MQYPTIFVQENETAVVLSAACNECFVYALVDGKEFCKISLTNDKTKVTEACKKMGLPNNISYYHTDNKDRNGLCHAVVTSNASNKEGIYVNEIKDTNGDIHLDFSHINIKEDIQLQEFDMSH